MSQEEKYIDSAYKISIYVFGSHYFNHDNRIVPHKQYENGRKTIPNSRRKSVTHVFCVTNIIEGYWDDC